jgi:hypothetical protein
MLTKFFPELVQEIDDDLRQNHLKFTGLCQHMDPHMDKINAENHFFRESF